MASPQICSKWGTLGLVLVRPAGGQRSEWGTPGVTDGAYVHVITCAFVLLVRCRAAIEFVISTPLANSRSFWFETASYHPSRMLVYSGLRVIRHVKEQLCTRVADEYPLRAQIEGILQADR